jgi:hypothetical protein
MSRESTIWGHFQNPGSVNTSWWQSTMFQSGLKLYHVELQIPTTPRGCFQRPSFHASEFLTSLIEGSDTSYLIMGSIITSWHHIILKQADKQKHLTSKSRTFYRRLSMRWEHHGKISYTKHYGLIEQPTKHLLGCHHTNLSTGRMSPTYRVGIQSSLGHKMVEHGLWRN